MNKEAREGTSWSARRIVAGFLTPEERREVATCAMASAGPDLLPALAEAARFRVQTLKRMPKDRILAKLDSHLLDPRLDAILRSALADYHLSKRRALMGAFLDRWGIPHDDGQIRPQEVTPPDPEAAISSAQELREKFPVRQIMSYYATAGLLMGLEDARWRTSLWPVVDELHEAESGGEGPGEGGEHQPGADAEAESAHMDSFTTLDHVLLRQIEASLAGIEGALSIDEVTDLIEEVIQLNAERHRSYYHRGFLRALLDDENDFDASERMARRRGWLIAGRVMALARRSEWEALCRLYDARRAEIDELLVPEGKRPIPRYVRSARKHLFNALIDQGRVADAIASMDARIAAGLGESFLYRLRSAGTKLLRERRPADAAQCYDLVRNAVTRHLAPEEALPLSFLEELDRRRAQCHRSLGRFAEAVQEFERLLGEARPEERGPLLVDVGLALGEFRGLTDVRVPRRQDDVPGVRKNVSKGMSYFEEALGVEKQRTNAHYVLGVAALIAEDAERAVHHLELAYLGAGERSGDYMQGGLLDQIRLYHSLSIMLSLDESRLGYAVDLLETVQERLPVEDWPEWLVRRVSLVVELGTSDAIRLMRFFVAKMPKVSDLYLRNGDHLQRVAELESRLEERSRASGRDLESRLGDLDCLVKHRIRQGRLEDALVSLDAIENLAMRNERCRVLVLDSLRTESYTPAWSEEEMLYLRGGFLEMDGELEQAAGVLLTLVYRHASRDEWDEAIGLFERLLSFGPAVAETAAKSGERVEAELARRKAEMAVQPSQAMSAGPIRVVFVGGNETQARYDDEVRALLAERFPSLEIDFEHTGWSSNWGRLLEDMQPKLERSHGIVVMHFIRTQLGRQLRKRAGDLRLPWGACTGHGREAIIDSIDRLARRILEQRRE